MNFHVKTLRKAEADIRKITSKMKYIDEFRDSRLARNLAAQIKTLSRGRRFKIMEICGGHTHTIYRHALAHLLPENIEMVHGPGCPVCVIPTGRVDDGIAIAHAPNSYSRRMAT